MWVVKIGGSLNTDPLLPEWLDLLVQLGGGRVTLVCGGGAFADEVRRAQAHWHFDDLAAQGIMIRSPSARGVAEEAPGAYKDVGAVVAAAEQAGLARRVAQLRPLICIKG